MIKKPTLIVLVCAVLLGGGVYYFNWKQSKTPATKDNSKPALSIDTSRVVALALSHPAHAGDVPVHFEKQGGTWAITQPIATAADQPSVQGLVDTLAGARSDQTEPGTADRKKAYGLDPAQASVELELQGGAKHAVLIGDKDFTGSSVYALVDNGQNVLLLPAALGDSTSKSLEDLRDRAVLHVDASQATSFELKNPSGALAATKSKDQWNFSTPAAAPADNDALNELLSAVANAKFLTVASESAGNLAKYGLATPAITLTVASSKGASSTLAVGKKDGDDYNARDTSRPTVFRISGDLYKKLTEGYSGLRDKTVLRIDTSDIQRAELRNDSGVVAVSRKKDNDEEWLVDSPADQKGKTAAGWKILDPISSLHAEEVLDHPGPAIVAQFIKPDVTVILTKKDGKDITLKISKPVGDFVYAQSSESGAAFKLKKEIVTGFSVKGTDLVL